MVIVILKEGVLLRHGLDFINGLLVVMFVLSTEGGGMNSGVIKRLLLAGAMTMGMAATANAELITVSNLTASGEYGNALELLVDGYIPDEYTSWGKDTNVYWEDSSVTLTLEFDGVYTLEDLLIQVDNNDDYLIEYSLNGTEWGVLYTISASSGDVSSGMDTFTTSEIDFSSVEAQYLRVSATGGDGLYAVSEIQSFGSLAEAVPEPSALLLLASGLFVLRLFSKRGTSSVTL